MSTNVKPELYLLNLTELIDLIDLITRKSHCFDV